MVIDQLTEEPIIAAKIKIDQNNHEAYTDFDGIAKIEDLSNAHMILKYPLFSLKNAY